MPPAGPYRDRFHDTLEWLERDVQAQAPSSGPPRPGATRRSPPTCACSPPSFTSTCTWNASVTWPSTSPGSARRSPARRGAGGGSRHLEQMSDTAVWMLERAADHAVDIAEQVWFLVTGELQEFDSASSVLAPAP